MATKLKPIEYSKRDYFKFLLFERLKKRLWYYFILLAVAVYLVIRGDLVFGFVFVMLPVVSLVNLVIYLWMYTNNPKNRIIFERKHYELDEDYLRGWLEDGTAEQVPLDRIVQVKQTTSSFYLYLAESLFIYLPRNAFPTKESLADFETSLQVRDLI